MEWRYCFDGAVGWSEGNERSMFYGVLVMLCASLGFVQHGVSVSWLHGSLTRIVLCILYNVGMYRWHRWYVVSVSVAGVLVLLGR